MWGTAVLINLTQNLQTEKASPERTTILHTVILYQVALFLCAAEYFRCIVLSASCNNLRLMAPSIAAVSYFSISYLFDQFRRHFLHRIPYFSMNAEPLAFFLIAGLNCIQQHTTYQVATCTLVHLTLTDVGAVGMTLFRKFIARIKEHAYLHYWRI